MLAEKHIKNAKMASHVWDSLKENQKEQLKQYFHLRPTASGVTIVSTHPIGPMRGIAATGSKDLAKKLISIHKMFPQIASTDVETVRKAMTELTFKKRNSDHNVLEENTQAIFINTMQENGQLQGVVHAHGPLKFIASEMIFQKGPYKIDVVGYDGKDLYLFELKKERTTRIDQVANYVKHYTQGVVKPVFDGLLSSYPINSVAKYDQIKAIMVLRYAENSSNKALWKDLSVKHGVEIIFYKPSLNFERAI